MFGVVESQLWLLQVVMVVVGIGCASEWVLIWVLMVVMAVVDGDDMEGVMGVSVC